MKSFAALCLFVASLGNASPLSATHGVSVPCHEYDDFVRYMCKHQQNGLVGGWCGRPPACLAGPVTRVPEAEINTYFNWKKNHIKVTCEKYDRYIAYECQEQKKNHPGLIGGYCGRPSSCQSAKELYVPDSEFESFMKWNDEVDFPNPMEVDCKDYDQFITYKCKEQMKNYPGLIGGYCGRRPTCQVSPKAMVPAREVEEYLKWKECQE